MPLPPRVVQFNLLSPEDKAYLLGLYLTDGSARRKKGESKGLALFLGRDEEELAEKVARIFRQIGLKPKIHLPNGRSWRCVVLDVGGKGLFPTFPDKRRFVSKPYEDVMVRKWFSDEQLDGELGIPFVAGLLDGDGCLRVSLRRAGIFGSVRRDWFFSQARYPFLIDYLTQYLSVFLAVPNSVAITHYEKTGVAVVTILASAREALLRKGIASFSFKVAKSNEEFELLEKELRDLKSRFYTIPQLAKRLKVDRSTVLLWCKRGFVKQNRVSLQVENKDRYWRIIPVEEVERVVQIVEKEKSKGRKRIPLKVLAGNS